MGEEEKFRLAVHEALFRLRAHGHVSEADVAWMQGEATTDDASEFGARLIRTKSVLGANAAAAAYFARRAFRRRETEPPWELACRFAVQDAGASLEESVQTAETLIATGSAFGWVQPPGVSFQRSLSSTPADPAVPSTASARPNRSSGFTMRDLALGVVAIAGIMLVSTAIAAANGFGTAFVLTIGGLIAYMASLGFFHWLNEWSGSQQSWFGKVISVISAISLIALALIGLVAIGSMVFGNIFSGPDCITPGCRYD